MTRIGIIDASPRVREIAEALEADQIAASIERVEEERSRSLSMLEALSAAVGSVIDPIEEPAHIKGRHHDVTGIYQRKRGKRR